MDELMAKLQSILGTKEGQEQLKNLQSAFNPSAQGAPSAPAQEAPVGDGQSPQQGGIDLSSIMSMFSGGAGQQDAQPQPETDSMPNIDINMILKLQQVFQSMNVNDKNSQLLYALKPHFSEKRQKKVDQAVSMMKLFAMLPLIKESGLFSGL